MGFRDDPFERIEAPLPGKASDPGRTAASNRLFVEAVLWIARTGSPWRDLPPEFGLWNSVDQRFARWSRTGVWQRVFTQLAQNADFEKVFIDSTLIRAHQHAAGAPKKSGDQALGRSRGGLSTKIHALVEGLGSVARFRLTGGEAGDSPQALPLLQDLHPDSVSADKTYDTDAILEHLAANDIQAVIPPRSHRLIQRPFDRHLYKNRHRAERFSSFVALTAVVIWLA